MSSLIHLSFMTSKVYLDLMTNVDRLSQMTFVIQFSLMTSIIYFSLLTLVIQFSLVTFADKLEESPAPYECDMVPHARCQEVIVTWTIGIQGDCVHKDTGFRLGKHGYKMVALQVYGLKEI